MNTSVESVIIQLRTECEDVADVMKRVGTLSVLQNDNIMKKALLYTLFTISRLEKTLSPHIDTSAIGVNFDEIQNCISRGFTEESENDIMYVSATLVPKIYDYFKDNYQPINLEDFNSELKEVLGGVISHVKK